MENDLANVQKLVDRSREPDGFLYFSDRILGWKPYPNAVNDKIASTQQLIAEAITREYRVAIKGATSTGKDEICARIALWFFFTFAPAKVIITGPTNRQVLDISFNYVRKAYKNARIPLGPEPMKTKIELSEDWFMTAFKPKEDLKEIGTTGGSTITGFHGENVLVIISEAQGFPPKLWEGLETLMSAPNARMIVAGNPTTTSGNFYNCFSRERDQWATFTMRADESPYVARKWLTIRKKKWGVDSPLYAAYVLGEFPREGSDVMIPLASIEAAVEREFEKDKRLKEKSLGVDVARFGNDDTVLSTLLDSVVSFESFQGQDTMRTAGCVQRTAKNEGIADECVLIDDTGVGGGVTDACRENDVMVVAVNFGARAFDSDQFDDVRSEMYWGIREALAEGTLSLPRDDELIQDLSDVRYKITSKGKIRMESKSDRKKRTGRSPDKGDAVALSVYARPKPGSDDVVTHDARKQNSPLLASISRAKGAFSKRHTPSRL